MVRKEWRRPEVKLIGELRAVTASVFKCTPGHDAQLTERRWWPGQGPDHTENATPCEANERS